MSLELELIRAYRRYLEHLAGKHNQKSHGNKYGSTPAEKVKNIRANVKRLGGDKDALKRMAARAKNTIEYYDKDTGKTSTLTKKQLGKLFQKKLIAIWEKELKDYPNSGVADVAQKQLDAARKNTTGTQDKANNVFRWHQRYEREKMAKAARNKANK